jgi:UDP-N-acetylglucosamine--N-acetylmuramyl-(pentapeptide) pyrophosphoryl-undecaprenol N-acetylglucosamine transferase
MAGGGTGGHVIPALAVASELRKRGHEAVFIGTRKGFEAKLVPQAGFPIEWIETGALNRIGWKEQMRTLFILPASLLRCLRLLGKHRPRAVFSMGGYVAGPVVMAALLRRIPVFVMEPNAMPGLANRLIGRFVVRALLSFEESAGYFPKGRSEITGLPVREAFFALPPRPPGEVASVLITGGSRGARSLNRAMRGSWELFRSSGLKVRLVHQTGTDAYEELAREFAATGLEGEIVQFIADMPTAFADADLVVCRSGAGAVAELAAAGKPAILVPFPFAADNHQWHNAEALYRAGAARLVEDEELSGRRMFEEIENLARKPDERQAMGERARTFGHPGAAKRAADMLEQYSGH